MTDANHPIYGDIDGPIIMIGFGSIGRCTLPLIERHFNFDKTRLVVIDPREDIAAFLAERNILHASDQGELQGSSEAAAQGRSGPGLLRQSFGRCRFRRSDAALPQTRHALYRHGG